MLVIAHRMSTIQHCECVVHLKPNVQYDVQSAEEFFEAAAVWTDKVDLS